MITNRSYITKVVVLILVVFGIHSQTHAQSVIELVRAEVIEYDQEFVDAERVKGNVQFKQDGVIMDCDSAYFFRKDNRLEAYGDIYIRQKDTFNLWGDYLEYDGNTKKALVRNNVRMTDGEMQLSTNAIEYDVQSKTAYYVNGGDIVNGSDRLNSRVGHYYSRSKVFSFKDSVKLRNVDYTMFSDTLNYNSNTKTAFFHGPTTIVSDENTIFCRYGWYDTRNNTSQFSKGAWIAGGTNKLTADSFVYNRNTGVGEAFRNISLVDTVEKVKIYGTYGITYRLTGKTMVTGSPIAVQESEDDTLYLVADTLLDQRSDSGERVLNAFPETRLYRNDIQGVCDSLAYHFTDSFIVMLGVPILWSDSSQITGDTLTIFRKNGQMDRMTVRKNAFINSYIEFDHFNQIDGRDMDAIFGGNKLKEVDVFGNGQSVYYVQDDDSAYIGVSHIICSNMKILLHQNKVEDVKYYDSPTGGLYPLNDFPAEHKKLKNFVWFPERRPHRDELLKRLPE